MLDALAASTSGQQLSKVPAEQGTAKQTTSRSRQEEKKLQRAVPESHLVGSFSRQLAPWPLTIATDHPAWQQKYADACMYM